MGPAFSLESAFNPVRQPVIGTDGSKIIYANPAALLAYGEGLCEKPQEMVFPAEVLENPSEEFACSAEICGRNANAFVRRQNGINLHYIEPISGTGGELYFTRSMLSHLRNCVTGLKIAADRCFTQLEDSVIPDNKLVSILYHYYYRLARTIIQLDSADKLERGEMAFTPEPTDIVTLCTELAETIMNLNREKDIKIVFSTEIGRLITMADPALIELMLINLFSNSLKNAESNSTIEFGLKLNTNNKIEISLNDNGRGIPDDKLGQIFSLPTDNTEGNRPEEGIGLGIYIANEIARRHGGTMFVTGKSNEGSCIRILIPATDSGAPVFGAPRPKYHTKSISPILAGLADVLSSECYGPRYED